MAMNITIEQTDIELAVEKHVRELIPGLSPETVVDINLSATRGPAGFTASIRLLSAAEAKAEKKASATPTPTATKSDKTEKADAPKKVQTTGTKPLGIAAKAAEAKAETAKPETTAPTAEAQVEPEPTEEEVARAADAMDLNAPVEEQAADAAVEEEAVEEAAEAAPTAEPEPAEEPAAATEEAPARQSLFGKLGKPQN